LIDGWIVRASWAGVEAYWIVKGYEHPDWGVVVVPYRVLGKRYPTRPDPTLFPGIEARLECMGRPVPVMPYKRITLTINPARALRLRLRDLPEAVRELVEYVNAEGLTGSWAVFQESPQSDVDLISYRRDSYKALKDLAAEGSLQPCPREPKWGPQPPPRRSLLDACYKGAPFTLRILRTREKMPCTTKRWLIGRYRGEVVITDIGEGFLTPARYEAFIPGVGSAILETWHTRYYEIPPGVYSVDLAIYYVEGEGYVASPDLYGRIKPARLGGLR
jgi:hypothetical protein